MSDPLSVAGSIVGILSLGIQAAQGLYDYYNAFKRQKSDVAHTTEKLERLLDQLSSLGRQLKSRKFQRQDSEALAAIEACIGGCEECIVELQGEVGKLDQTKSGAGFTATAKSTARRLAYPFRQSTLQKLDEDIDEILGHLCFALQILQQKEISQIRNDAEDAKALMTLIRADQMDISIRKWLKAPDVTANFNEACRKRHPGTGIWFIESSVFKTWIQTPSSFIWLTGFAGCGKSVLCSTVIQNVFKRCIWNARQAIGFFFFDFNEPQKQDASAMLKALVLQLSNQLSSGHPDLSRLRDTYRYTTTIPDHGLLDCLQGLIRSFQDVYIVIDAVDESSREGHRDAVLDALVDLRGWAEPNMHLFVASRDEVDIRDALQTSPSDRAVMTSESVDKDVAMFIAQHLRRDRRLRKWENYHGRIETALTERAKGLFRWVDCQFKALASCPQSEDLLDQLLNSLPHTLDDTYGRMLRAIPQSSQHYARQMLTLLCCAMRPLTVSQLIDGVAVELRPVPILNTKRRLRDADAIQEVCPGFVEVYYHSERKETYVRIAHFSIQEYLESERICQQEGVSHFHVSKRSAHVEMTQICMAILLSQQLLTSVSARKEYPFAVYAAAHWISHFGYCGEDTPAEGQVLQLFQGPREVFRNFIRLYSPYLPEEYSPMHFASSKGLYSVLEALLRDVEADVNSFDVGGTPLMEAANRGHRKIAELLVARGADVNLCDGLYDPAIITAAKCGHADIVQLLLDHGADVNIEGGLYGTALVAAACYNHKTIVETLLSRGADVYIAGKQAMSPGTPLMAAERNGHAEVVEILISHMTDDDWDEASSSELEEERTSTETKHVPSFVSV